MIRIITPEKFEKRLRKFLKQHPELMDRYKKTMQILVSNPNHPSLRLHKLSGNLKSLYSVSITMKYRITLEFYIEGDTITLINIGDHDEVY